MRAVDQKLTASLVISDSIFVDDWNKLDTNIKSAGNFNIFKQRFWSM